MNKRCCMLVILLLCVFKASCDSDELTDADYYDTTKSGETSDTPPLTTFDETTNPARQIPPEVTESTQLFATQSTAEAATVTVTSPETIAPEDANQRKCPPSCKCTNEFGLVDCSHQNFTQIPNNLPQNTVELNLSHNLLTTLNVSDLIIGKELQQLNLNNNQIETIIDTDKFAKLPNLHHIDLSSNALKPLNGAEFVEAKALATLILSGNKDAIQTDIPIVHAHKLKTLKLANCSITHFSDKTFENLTSLVILDLENNPIEPELNLKSFKYLINLRTLNIPTVSSAVVKDLCNTLERIDMLHLTNETYDLSCFLLTAGSTFEDSTVRGGQATVLPVDNDDSDLYKTIIASTTKRSKVKKLKNNTKNVPIDEPRAQSSEQQKSDFSQTEIVTDHVTNSSGSTESSNEIKTSQVDVPQNVIHMLLIGLIALTLVAILIGICCRLDCCGVKTKCCRRSHNRAETEDHVQPHEEIPLNKV